MDSTQLQNLLMEKAHTMPNKARRVAEYLLANMREASFRSIGDIADELKVSKAQLVRVAQMLGFSGYAELKACLQKTILEQINPAALLARAVSSNDSFPDSIFKAEHANLDDTMAQLVPADIDKFCEMVKGANNIYCIGWGISSLVMELMQIRLTVLGCRALLCRRGGLSLWEQVRSVREGDIVIVCELPSYAVEVTESVEIAHRNGAKVITMTDSAGRAGLPLRRAPDQRLGEQPRPSAAASSAPSSSRTCSRRRSPSRSATRRRSPSTSRRSSSTTRESSTRYSD